MICFHEKGIDVIRNAFTGANKGVICTPYYTERGLKLLDSFFDTAEEVEFWTRLNPLDWRDGVADMEALKRRVQKIMDRRKKITLHGSDDLHAKIYSFSNNKVIIGSANLTWSAMTTNIETICELTDADATSFLSFLPIFRSRLAPVPVDVFSAYVDIVSDVIHKTFEDPVEEDEDMDTAITLAEETLSKTLAKTARKASPLLHLEIEGFFEYCQKEKTDVSREIIARGKKGKHNLQGHVKHCYYGSLRFLSQFPQFVTEIASTPGEELYEFSNPSIREHWRNFLSSNADMIDEPRQFRFRTLRLYLPPKLGGTRMGGGGGSPTLKRVFPVVARMLQKSGKNK
ncbi:MAG: NgoFVII family restriction endonuclease [Sedimentisphaerales bacterium]|nr:NgoFVII family restriction endonuclease [Sedimentisphaerales bacterium]